MPHSNLLTTLSLQTATPSKRQHVSGVGFWGEYHVYVGLITDIPHTPLHIYIYM